MEVYPICTIYDVCIVVKSHQVANLFNHDTNYKNCQYRVNKLLLAFSANDFSKTE